MLHLAEAVLIVEEIHRACCLRKDAHDKVSLGVNALELVKSDDFVAVRAMLVTGLLGATLDTNDLCAESFANAGTLRADITVANDGHRLLRTECNRTLFPYALILLGREELDTLRMVKHA